ncbi:hypothetical protein VTO73DRAFT_1525 [Trametes versicolor]
MERLRLALGIPWSYVDAISHDEPVVDSIIDCVKSVRSGTGTRIFEWPSNLASGSGDSDSSKPPPPSESSCFPPVPHAASTTFSSAEFSSGDTPVSNILATSVQPSHDIPVSSRAAAPLTSAREDHVHGVKFTSHLPSFMLLTPARIACWYSHLTAIQQIADYGHLGQHSEGNQSSLRKPDDAFLILEDDVDMEQDISERLRAVWNVLPAGWDIVFLGHCWSNESHHPALVEPDALSSSAPPVALHPSFAPKCTHAYADPTATPVWATGNAPDTVPPAWPPDVQNQPQEPPQVPMSQLTSEADIFFLTQQTDTLHLLQSQVYQTSQDSAELTCCIADQAASTFCLVYSASSSGNAATLSTGSVRPVTVKIRKPHMFLGKADDVELFICEVKACVQLQRGTFLTDVNKTLYFSLYLKSDTAKSWYNTVQINEPALLTNFYSFIRVFVKCFQTTDLAAKYLTKIETVQQTRSAASYANQFLECLTYLDWTKETKLTQFNRGLKPDLLRTLAITKRKSTLDKWIAVIILADNNLFKIDQELKRHGINRPAQTSKSVQSNTANSQSSAKEHRRKNNLCVCCGKGSHTFKNCPRKNPAMPAFCYAGKA